jgi:hypothetical protein
VRRRGRLREESQCIIVADEGEVFEVGCALEAAIFGYEEWEVVEIRPGRGPFISAFDVRCHSTPVSAVGSYAAASGVIPERSRSRESR